MVQWLRLHASTAGGTGLIPHGILVPDQGSKFKKKFFKVTSANAVGGRKETFHFQEVSRKRLPSGRPEDSQITMLQRKFTAFTKATMNVLLRGAPP